VGSGQLFPDIAYPEELVAVLQVSLWYQNSPPPKLAIIIISILFLLVVYLFFNCIYCFLCLLVIGFSAVIKHINKLIEFSYLIC
jgi:hypothetical protein